jgi:hypothetical protein
MRSLLIRGSVLVLACAWSGCAEPEPDLATETAALTRDTTLVRTGSYWWVAATAGDQGTAWREPGFIVTTDRWSVGPAPFGYGESYVRPISSGSDPAHKPPTVYARTDFTIADPARVRALRLDAMFDDGIVVYLNGAEVLRANMPAGPVSYGTLAMSGEANNTYHPYDLTAQLGHLVEGSNILAVEIHQSSASSSDLVLGAALVAQVEDAPPPPTDGGIPRTSEWSYWDNGGDLGSAWRTPGHDTSAWRRGRGPLGYGETYLNTTVGYGPSASTKYITTYARRDFNVVDPAAIATIRGELMYDDGVVVYLNGQRIGSAAMPAGTVTASTPALGHEAGNAYETFDWSAFRNLLVAGTNTLAFEIHQQAASSSDLVFDASLTLTLAFPPAAGSTLPKRSTWAYWDRGGDLGTAWRAPGYADGAWLRGAGPLGYGETYLGTTVGYGPNASAKYPTTYFRTDVNADLPAGESITELTADVMYDDGAVLYLNGQEIHRVAMPAGPITAATRALGHEAGNAYETYDLTAFADRIVAGDNVVAVEVHQLDAGSSDLVMDVGLTFRRAPVFHPIAANPIIEPPGWETGPSWRQDEVSAPQVLRLAADQWVMYYTGNDGVGPHEAVGRATSSDGIHWTLGDQPVVWGRLQGVLYDGTTYRMYLSDFYGDGLELLTSTDGLTWSGQGTVLDGVFNATILRDGTTYKLWAGHGTGLTYATSPDGVTWTRHGDVLAGDRLWYPTVMKDGSVYKLWYADDGGLRYATSLDGVAWTVRGHSLPASVAPGWTQTVHSACVMRDGDTLKMWFTAGNGDVDDSIYYATHP